MPGGPVARLVGVEAGYGNRGRHRRVLAGVDLEIERGETVALVGRNGSGKTTLLNVVAGTVRPTEGRVELLARSIDRWSRVEIARRVAVVPQSVELPAGMTAAEAVALGRIPHGRSVFGREPGDERAVEAALVDAGALDLAERRVTELSGGERQRVVLAMALAQAPRLLLLDEPTLHLDLAHQLALVELLDRLRRTRELTVLAVLHDLNLAAALGDRVVVLHEGRLVDAGAAGQVFDADLARRTFGVPVEEAVTAGGRRVLAVGGRITPRH